MSKPPISFTRLQEYLDLIVQQEGGDLSSAPHRRFWVDHQTLTTQPIPAPKCHGQPILPIKFLDPERTKVDADNSPMFLILTDIAGFCQREQMPPGGPFISDTGYSLTLSDGTVVSGAQVIQDIHDWLAAGALDDD